MKWYFAYGSNMDSQQLRCRIGRNPEWRKGWIKGYSLTFNKCGSDGTGKANIEPDDLGIVYGVLYLLTEEEFRRLDKHEGVPNHYVRKRIEVETEEGKVHAECYVAMKSKIQKGFKPTRNYLNGLIKGAQEHCLPPDYIDELKSLETVD